MCGVEEICNQNIIKKIFKNVPKFTDFPKLKSLQIALDLNDAKNLTIIVNNLGNFCWQFNVLRLSVLEFKGLWHLWRNVMRVLFSITTCTRSKIFSVLFAVDHYKF